MKNFNERGEDNSMIKEENQGLCQAGLLTFRECLGCLPVFRDIPGENAGENSAG